MLPSWEHMGQLGAHPAGHQHEGKVLTYGSFGGDHRAAFGDFQIHCIVEKPVGFSKQMKRLCEEVVSVSLTASLEPVCRVQSWKNAPRCRAQHGPRDQP